MASVLILLTRYLGLDSGSVLLDEEWQHGNLITQCRRPDVAGVRVAQPCDDRAYRAIELGVGQVGGPAAAAVSELAQDRSRTPPASPEGGRTRRNRCDQGVQDLESLAAIEVHWSAGAGLGERARDSKTPRRARLHSSQQTVTAAFMIIPCYRR